MDGGGGGSDGGGGDSDGGGAGGDGGGVLGDRGGKRLYLRSSNSIGGEGGIRY